MPIALINLGSQERPLTIMYSMTPELSKSDMGDGWRGEHKHYDVPGAELSYVIRPDRGVGKPESLWITGQNLTITGQIANQGKTGALEGWSVGFIQSIHHSERIAYYEGNLVRKLRLNTLAGPLKDGGDETIFYEDEKPVGESRVIYLDDAPNFEAPLCYGLEKKRLIGTDGYDQFSTHFVLVRGKSIIQLARLNWTINWKGHYDWKATDGPWTPEDANAFLQYSQSQDAELYANLDSNRVHTPFSLDLNEAEVYCEIFEDGDWHRCNMVGNRNKGKNKAPSSWRTSAI